MMLIKKKNLRRWMLETNNKQILQKTFLQKYELIMPIKFSETKRKQNKAANKIY